MTRGRRILKLTAVAAVVVFALTGFSRGHGRHHSSHGSGGGCSSSSQDHDSSSSSTSSGSSSGSLGKSDDSTYGSSSGSSYNSTSGTSGSSSTRRSDLRDGRARLVNCATEKRSYATVEVSNGNRSTGEFRVSVDFYDAQEQLLTFDSRDVEVPGNGKKTVAVPVSSRYLKDIDHCKVDPEATLTRN
ncbi:hypothetical protein ABII15_21965 [Streptomyces sp. HUAS MG91]|uniref:Secreted protein n=1 Tax=Streptomyces tabacisoli TaxID=3156398 RepID=A0AAU8J4I4_9ACTN